jgi:hypothetical protein
MSTNHPNQTQLGFISHGLFAMVNHANITGLWFMEIMETRGCSNLNSSMATYQLYCLVKDKALLTLITTLITATLMEDIHICKDEFGPDSVSRRRSSTTGQQNRTIPRICLFIPVTQQMKRLVNKKYLKQLNSSSCQWKSVI